MLLLLVDDGLYDLVGIDETILLKLLCLDLRCLFNLFKLIKVQLIKSLSIANCWVTLFGEAVWNLV